MNSEPNIQMLKDEFRAKHPDVKRLIQSQKYRCERMNSEPKIKMFKD